MTRKIIHIDMDAFYASIEQRDNPNFRGKPLVVGHSTGRGVVAAASYEARKYGIYSAMPSRTALAKYPQLIFTPPRFQVYKEVSMQIRSIFKEYTDLVEPLSLDEAFLDVTQNYKNMAFAMDIAQEIRIKIWQKTQLTASAGISYNKFLAKIASDYNKPNGMFVITPKRAAAFIEQLPVEKFFGIGKKTAEKMHQMKIFNGYDLKQKDEDFLTYHFGKTGHTYYLNARGLDYREVNPNRIRKSMGTENTFREDTSDPQVLTLELELILDDLYQQVQKSNFRGRTLTLKIKYSDFKIVSKSRTLPEYVDNFEVMRQTSFELFKQIALNKKIRLIGLSIKNSDIESVFPEQRISPYRQLKLPFDPKDRF